MYSIKIENGQVFDSTQKAFIHATVGVNDTLIKTVEPHSDSGNAQILVDASNLYVAPGFIDFHGHFFEQGSDIGVDPDLASLPFGITALGDAGSTGVSNFESFLSQILRTAHVTMRCFINLSPAGLVTTKYHEDVNPAIMDEDKIALLYAKHKDVILGLKLRLSKEVVGEHGMAPLKKARSIADKLGCILNVHVTNPAGSIVEMLRYFKAGDVFTHVFHGKGETIIKDDKVMPEILSARKRGVIFDAANGGTTFHLILHKPQ